jgi:hypothetical protein
MAYTAFVTVVYKRFFRNIKKVGLLLQSTIKIDNVSRTKIQLVDLYRWERETKEKTNLNLK